LPRKRGKGSKAEFHVARLYERAGYKVRRNVRSRAGEIDILAKRGDKKLLIEVKSGKQTLTSADVMKVVRKARYHGAKPVIRKSKRTRLTSNASNIAKRYGVRIRDYIYVKGTAFGGFPMTIEAKLTVDDKSMFAGAMIDAIRGTKIALDRGVGGPIISVSAPFFKHPPVQAPSDEIALQWFEEFIQGKRER